MPFEIGPAIEASKRKEAEMATWSVSQWMLYCLSENVNAMKRVKEGRDKHWRKKLLQVIEDDDCSSEQQQAPMPAPQQRKKRARQDHNSSEFLLTVSEAATLLQMHRNEVYALIQAGKLESIQLLPGGKHRIVKMSLERYIEEQVHGKKRQTRRVAV